MPSVKRLRTLGVVIHRAEVFTTTDYHFLIARNGTVQDLVPVSDKADHAIAFNNSTIGVAVFGDFACGEPGINNHPTYQQIVAVVALLKKLNAMYGGSLWCAGHSQLGPTATSFPEKLTFGHTCPGENFPLTDVILRSGLLSYMAK